MNRAEWPGIVIAKRGQFYVVHHVADSKGFKDLPEVGAKLKSCDGRTTDNLMKKNVFPFSGNKDLAAHWIEQAPMLFVDYGNPFVKRPKECLFIGSSSKAKSYKLSWRSIRVKNLEPHLKKAGFGERPTEFAHRQFGTGNHWISIPTFSPSGKKADQLESIIAALDKLRTAKVVVFDVRGNGGGNSQWGNNIVEKLYGKKYKDYRESLRPNNSYVEWRTSPENLKYLNKVVPGLKERFGAESSIYRVFSAVANKMAGGKSDQLLRQPEFDDLKPSTNISKATSPVKAKVFFLTDGHCGSACLDFADKLLNMGKRVVNHTFRMP
jgi:hypothetical protein